MAIGSDLRRYDVCPQVPVPGAFHASGESDESDESDDLAMDRIDALGSAPAVRVHWPELIDLPRRRSLWPAMALLSSGVAVLAAALVVLANQPSRRANAKIGRAHV